MNLGEISPKKNLWKNLRTEKGKYSGVQQTSNSPILSNSKQSNHNSQPLRSLNNQIKPKEDLYNLESKFGLITKQMQFQLEQNSQHESEQDKSSTFLVNPKPVVLINDQSKNKEGKLRRLSHGQESIVEQIVDFKNQHNLQIGDFDQDQQPMIMSLGSQSNPAIRQLKLSKMKDEIQKLQIAKAQILAFLNEQQSKCQDFFQKSIHNLLAYVLQYYSDKLQCKAQENAAVNNLPPNKLHSPNSFSNMHSFISPSIIKQRNSLTQQQTPGFPKKFSEMQMKKITLQHQLELKIQQNHKLEEQIYKTKLKNQNLMEIIKSAQKQNEQMSEVIFDYEQKIAQFQLQVNQKVQAVIQKRISIIKQQQKKKYNQFSQTQRNFYSAQIQKLEKQIQQCELKSYNHDLNQLFKQVSFRQQRIIEKQKQLQQKQTVLNQFHAELNSQKLNLQLKMQQNEMKQAQLKAKLIAIQHRELQISLKQKQLKIRYSDRNNDRETSKNRQSDIFEKTTHINRSNGHKKTYSGEQKQIYVQQESDHKNAVSQYKLFNNIKYRDSNPNRYISSKQHASSNLAYNGSTSNNNNLNLNLNLNAIHNYKQLETKNKWRYGKQLQHQLGDRAQRSQPASRQKSKSNIIINKTFVGSYNPNPGYYHNKTSIVSPKSKLTGISFTRSNLNYNINQSHSSGNRTYDKNRLEDLGSKLQNLRNQIRKQIHETD